MFKSPTYCFLAGATSVQGHRPDFNNDLGGDSNSGPVLYPRRLFKSNSNNGPSLGHSNLVSDEVYICSGLLFMIFWWLLWPSGQVAKCPMPDFNKGAVIKNVTDWGARV